MAKATMSLLALALLAALAVAAAAPISGEARKRPAKCKGHKIPVKVNGKRTCKPVGSVLPKPKPIDLRLGYLRGALEFDAFKAKARRGKPRRSVKPGVRRAATKARKRFLRALPKALAMIDARLATHAVASRAGCGSIMPVGEPGKTGGLTIRAGIDAGGGDAKGGFIEYTVNGFTSRMSFKSCGNLGASGVPDCPTANGDADGSSEGSIDVSQQVLKDGEVVFSQTTSRHVENKSHGKVADDARLDYIDIDNTDETLMVQSGGVVFRSTVIRKVRVDMRSASPSYDPARRSVTIRGDDLGGEEGFASLVADEIKYYRVKETGWSTFDRGGSDYCANPVFTPATNSLKLRKDKSDDVSIYAAARDGGKAAGVRWTILDPVNASFSPTSSSEREPAIHYVVTEAPPGGQVQMTVKFTSTAGVGQGVWTQPTDSSEPLYLGEMQGQLDELSPGQCGADYDFSSYHASLQSPAINGGGPFRIRASSEASGYDETGSGTVTLFECAIDDPGCTGGMHLDPDTLRAGSVFFQADGSNLKVLMETSDWLADGECGKGINGPRFIGEGTLPLSKVGDQTITVTISRNEADEDGRTWTGSGTLTLQRVN